MCALIAFVILLALEIHCQLHEPNAKGGSGDGAREGRRRREKERGEGKLAEQEKHFSCSFCMRHTMCQGET